MAEIVQSRSRQRARQLLYSTQELDGVAIQLREFLGMVAAFGVRNVVKKAEFRAHAGAEKAAGRTGNGFAKKIDNPQTAQRGCLQFGVGVSRLATGRDQPTGARWTAAPMVSVVGCQSCGASSLAVAAISSREAGLRSAVPRMTRRASSEGSKGAAITELSYFLRMIIIRN